MFRGICYLVQSTLPGVWRGRSPRLWSRNSRSRGGNVYAQHDLGQVYDKIDHLLNTYTDSA